MAEFYKKGMKAVQFFSGKGKKTQNSLQVKLILQWIL